MSQASLDISRLVVFGDSLSDNGNLFKLTGEPPPPYWEGRFSNGPTYAEQLAQLLGAHLNDRAFGGATASNSSPGVLLDPLTGTPLPINLPEQIGFYLAQLHGHRAPADTTAVIYIGNNDYINYLESDLPKDPQTALELVSERHEEHLKCNSCSHQRGRREDRVIHAARPGGHARNSGAWTQRGRLCSRARRAQQRGVGPTGRESP